MTKMTDKTDKTAMNQEQKKLSKNSRVSQKLAVLLLCIFSFIFLYFTFCLLNSAIILASSSDGTIDVTYKYAWGENIGWLNFGTNDGNVHIADSAITGYAWSQNYGWINLAPTTSGVKNNSEGILSGYAWGENLGWIDFSGVSINSSGEFSGLASGTTSGRISFDCSRCKVKTDWRPQSSRTTTSPNCGDGMCNNNETCSSCSADCGSCGGGGLPPEAYNPPSLPITLTINNGAEYTNSHFVTLNLKAGSDVGTMIISNSSDFSGANQEVYASTKSWDLCYGRSILTDCPAENAVYTVYTKFYTKQWGRPSEIISESIMYLKKSPEKPLMAQLPKILEPFIPEFLKPKSPLAQPPEIPLEKLLSEQVPLTMKAKWILLDPRAIARLVFTPLPQDIKLLVQRIPQLEKTFSEVGITRMTELEKLRVVKLTLPGLTNILGLPSVKPEPGKFVLPQAVPIAKLSPTVKEKLPDEIVFAKTGGGLIDFNIVLNLSEKGKTQQKITTIVGKPLQLVIKPEKPVKGIKGYLVFKSRKTQSAFLPLSFYLGQLSRSLFLPAGGANPILSQLQEKPAPIEESLVLQEFEYTDPDADGIYSAEIKTPLVDGEYEIITVIEYQDLELGKRVMHLIAVVDPEGYIYEKNGDKETRIPGAIVSLYWLNPETKQYEFWSAKEYSQENPQTTDIRGTYAFLAPEGFYHLKVDAPGYLSYEGKPFQVSQAGGIHTNIELKTRYWWLKIVDWKTVILFAVILLLIYNFYRDRKKERLLGKYR